MYETVLSQYYFRVGPNHSKGSRVAMIFALLLNFDILCEEIWKIIDVKERIYLANKFTL